MIGIVDVDKAVIARYERKGRRFEILVDPYKAWDLRSGKEVPLEDVVVTPEIFRDVKKGERASEEEIKEVFGEKSKETILLKIVKDGDVHLTTEQRRKMLEEKKQKIANIIAKRAINPITKTPHPPQRILSAMEESRVDVNIFQPAEEQVNKVVEEIKKIIPIKIESKRIEIKIPAQFAGKVYGKLKSHKVIREEWLNDGSLKMIIEVPAGMLDDVLGSLAQATHGEIESKMVE